LDLHIIEILHVNISPFKTTYEPSKEISNSNKESQYGVQRKYINIYNIKSTTTV